MRNSFHCEQCKRFSVPKEIQENTGRFLVCPYCGAKHQLVATVDKDGTPIFEVFKVIPKDKDI